MPVIHLTRADINNRGFRLIKTVLQFKSISKQTIFKLFHYNCCVCLSSKNTKKTLKIHLCVYTVSQDKSKNWDQEYQ